jgi:hypothetical protein
MMTLSTGTPSEIKKVVSTTSCFQRSGADILQVSDHQAQKFPLYEQLSAENGLTYVLQEWPPLLIPPYLERLACLVANLCLGNVLPKKATPPCLAATLDVPPSYRIAELPMSSGHFNDLALLSDAF